MTNENSRLTSTLQHPTSSYDYDGITGTWLLIPAKFHILMLAITLPVIIWMFPFIHLKGDYRYVFADYRYYIAGAVTIFSLSSAILSIIKAKQVGNRLRPTSEVHRPSVTKVPRATNHVPAKKTTRSQDTLTQAPKSSSSKPKNIAQKRAKSPVTSHIKEKVPPKSSTPKSPAKAKTKMASNTTSTTNLAKNSTAKNSTKANSKAAQSSAKKVSPTKRKKNSQQMQLDL